MDERLWPDLFGGFQPPISDDKTWDLFEALRIVKHLSHGSKTRVTQT